MSRDDAPDDARIRVGFEGHFEEIEATKISKKDILPYQPGQPLAVVGKRLDRADAFAKVTGRAKYTYDQNPKGLLYGKIVRCPHANADVKSVDLTAARALPGVKAVVDLSEALRHKSCLYAWDSVAAVAAETEAQAAAAAAAVKVEYDVLPFAVTLDDALAPDAPAVARREQQNVVAQVPRRVPSRERWEAEQKERLAKVEALLAQAEIKVEGTFETPVQIHQSLEPHGHVCAWDGESQLTVHASTQATFAVKDQLGANRAVGAQAVRVLSEYVGGGFGSKFSPEAEGVACALLAKAAGAPVKLMLDRREESTDGGNRPDSRQKMTMALRRDGTIAATKIECWGTPGPGSGGAGANNNIIYALGEVSKREYAVRTNCGEARAMRAPGHPQGVFALEAMMDMAAEALGMDAIELRKKNDSHPIRQAEYEIGKAKIGWDQKRQKTPGAQAGPIKTGVGAASSVWYAAGGEGATVRVRIHKNGAVEARNGAQDIGTGTRTIIGMVVAEELGLELRDVQTFIGDTQDPEGPGSGGSTTAPTVTPAARLAAYRAKEQLCELAAAKLNAAPADLDLRGGQVVRKDGAALPVPMSFKEACALMTDDSIDVSEKRQRNYEGYQGQNAGVQFAEVEVDTETGIVRVKKVVAVADAGKIMNHKLAESQVSGGVIQGVSYALFERRTMDRHKGHMVNADLEMYKIAGPVDCPEIDVHLMDVYNGVNNTNVMGIGEPPNIATAAAIANAVSNAIGVRVKALPITPRAVLTALAEKEATKK
jgi:xanthine dehydrogenase YagR molybdenum-binding subunit